MQETKTLTAIELIRELVTVDPDTPVFINRYNYESYPDMIDARGEKIVVIKIYENQIQIRKTKL